MATRHGSTLKQLNAEIEQTPEEYRALLLRIVQSFRESVTLKTAKDSFRQGWKEAVTNDTRPIHDLWEGVEVKGK